jgi:hypothetical protein
MSFDNRLNKERETTMKIHPLAKALAAATLATALATPALADTVQLNSFTYGSQPMTVSSASPAASGTYPAGQFSGFLNSNAFVTFCTDLQKSFSLGTTYTNYSIVNGLTAWGSTVYQGMNRLMSYGYANGLPNNSTNSAVFQAAVWEVIYQPDGVYDFNAGNFKASSSDGATQTALNTWNWATVMSTPISHTTNQLLSSTNQNFLVTTPVPEPESYAMMLAGLSLVGAIARRRRSSAN